MSNVNVNDVDADDDTPLHWASRWDNDNVVDLQIKNSISGEIPRNVYSIIAIEKRKIADSFAKNGLRVSQRKHGFKKIAELLINNGANVSLTNYKGRTALHEAANWGIESEPRIFL